MDGGMGGWVGVKVVLKILFTVIKNSKCLFELFGGGLIFLKPWQAINKLILRGVGVRVNTLPSYT